MSAELQSDEVVSFWRYMQERFGTTTVNKADAVEMQIIAGVLDTLGILDKERFLRNFTTTLGRKIYTPFDVGTANDGWDLWGQVVVCVHEHQHVVQHDREGLSFEVSYVADRAARARFEAEAYRSNLEMHFWRFRTPDAIAPAGRAASRLRLPARGRGGRRALSLARQRLGAPGRGAQRVHSGRARLARPTCSAPASRRSRVGGCRL